MRLGAAGGRNTHTRPHTKIKARSMCILFKYSLCSHENLLHFIPM